MVEAVFEFAYAAQGPFEVAVAGEHEDRCVRSPGDIVRRPWGRRIGIEVLLRDMRRLVCRRPPSDASDRGCLAVVFVREAEDGVKSNLNMLFSKKENSDIEIRTIVTMTRNT